jgi:toxin YhaV
MTVNGWKLHVYPDFAREYDALIGKVETVQARSPETSQSHPATRLLDTVNEYIRVLIPNDPGAKQFRQGNTLGKENKQWFRAKFHGRYRLFFRFSTQHRAIVYVWMSSEKTLRKAGARSDLYALFATMLESGNPPADFDELLKRSRDLPQPAE